jgi:hypothetical protein
MRDALMSRLIKRLCIVVAASGLALLAQSAWADDLPPLKSAIDATFAPHAMPKIGGDLEGFNIDVVDDIRGGSSKRST